MAFVPTFQTTLAPGLKHVCAQPGALPLALPTASSAAPSRRWTTPSPSTPCMSASRKFLVGGNWKCNLDTAKIADLVSSLNTGPPLDSDAVEVVVAPPAPYLKSVRDSLRADFSVAGQNSWLSAGGAFTGETDAAMLADVGAGWVLLGHSERRHIAEIKETDETIATKAAYVLESTGLSVIYCIGELLMEREAGQTLAVCTRQLNALKAKITNWDRIVIAYEPVWAIGTGKVASPEQAEEVHAAVRKWLKDEVAPEVANTTRVLYGGSVSPKNCNDLATQPNVDGFLVGGASLTPTFLDIVDSYKTALAGAV